MMVDIDHFKKINDEHGHGVGDKVLKMIAKLLESKFGDKASICRYGGEELCVLLPGTGLDKTIEIAQEVRSTIESYATMGIETRTAMAVTASLGVSAIEQGATAPVMLRTTTDRKTLLTQDEFCALGETRREPVSRRERRKPGDAAARA